MTNLSNIMNKKIVVLNWMDITNPDAGGQEKYVYEMSKRLIREGYRVIWLTSGYSGSDSKEILSGIEIIRTGSIYTYFIKYFKYYLKLRKGAIFFLSMNSIPFIFPFRKRSRFLMLHHRIELKVMKEKIGILGYFAYFLQEFLNPIIYRNDLVITNSQSSKEDFKRLGYRNITVTKLGIDLPDLNLDLKRKWIVSPGPVKPWKRHDLAMKAFSQLDNEWKMVIFGMFESETYRQSLVSLSDDLGIRDRVMFLGRISDDEVKKIYRESKICVLGTEKEGWGIVAMEAQSYGCPVVAFEVSGIKENVINGTTGILVKFGDVDAMAKAMKELISDDVLYNKMSRSAMERAKGYTWDECYLEFVKELRKVLTPSIDHINWNILENSS